MMKDLFDFFVEKLNIKAEKRADTALILRKVFPVIATGLVFVFVMLTFLNSTYTWFANNRTVSGNGMSIVVGRVSNMMTMDCYALRYDGVNGATCIEIGEDTPVTMSEYDMIFTDRNVNTPLIFRMVVCGVPTEEDSYISIRIPCTQKYVVTLSDSEEYNEYELDDMTQKSNVSVLEVLSNVLVAEIGCGLLEDEEEGLVPDTYAPVPTENATTLAEHAENLAVFEGVRNAVKATDHSGYAVKQFATVTETETTTDGVTRVTGYTFEKTSEIELTISYDDYKDFLYIPGDERKTSKNGTLDQSGDCFVLNIVLDYDNELVDAFNEFLGGDIEGIVKFSNDLGTIVIVEGGM